MKLRYFFFSTILFICVSCFVFAQNNYRRHIIKQGETVYSIASTYKVSLQEIYDLNPQAENGLKINQELILPATFPDKKEYLLHSIEPKETLYSVSKKYNVSIEEIMTANDGLTTENFRVGNVVKIPQYTYSQNAVSQETATDDNFLHHKVAAKETLYSISKQYNVSIENIFNANPGIKRSGLKKDSEILIPISDEHIVSSTPIIAESTPVYTETSFISAPTTPITTQAEQVETSIMKVGLLLPFHDPIESQQARFLEYYRGFLIAVEDIKAKGYSAEIYAWDIRKGNSTEKLKSLLDTYEMKSLDLLIGGVTEEEVNLISEFTKAQNIKYAAPFPIRNDNVLSGSNAFQVSTSVSALYPKVASTFSKQFSDYNVIIYHEIGYNDKSDFTSLLESQLSQSGISFQSVYHSEDIQRELADKLSSTKRNIIVPSSSNSQVLTKIFPVLNKIKEDNSELTINLFGYPDWQVFTSQFLKEFYNHGVYIYTPFYADTRDFKIESFQERYMKWYGETPMNTYPKYGLLGYDTGIYFLTALGRYGNSFENNLPLAIQTLQSPFYFQIENGTYKNMGLYFVHYTTYSTIEKIDYSR